MVNRIEEMVEIAGLGDVLYAVERVCDAKAVQTIHANPKAAHHWHSISDNANGATDIAGVFNTTSAIFSGPRLLNAD
jgi:hypothetical protein